MKRFALILIGLVSLAIGTGVILASAVPEEKAPANSRLAVVWSSADPDVAHKVCFMYTHNAKRARWFDEVTLIVWGPSARLLAADKELQAKVRTMMADGVKVEACVVCADSYRVSDQLRKMGIDVKPEGKPLTDMLRQNWKVLTF